MRAAFVGKGGSGKTTTAALFARYLAAEQVPVIAFDGDINQHLAGALGAKDDEAAALPVIGDHLDELKAYFRGNNARIRSVQEMTKTTPPGRGSKLWHITDHDNPVWGECVRPVDGVPLAQAGTFDEADIGTNCYHSKTGTIELVLNYLQDGENEYAVVDMTAGADAFASGLFSRFDRTFLVCEPTLRSVSVYEQYKHYATEYGIHISVVGNKVADEHDEQFLRAHVGDDLIACFGLSPYVKAAEKGVHQPLTMLEAENLEVLRTIRQKLDSTPKDWATFTRQAHEFHAANAIRWSNANMTDGYDLREQIDPTFTR
ncbi:MAG TPA: hypothetical protein VD735_04210 [Candidatus Saccharimonadales bacterium]|nr:hypothetical protein [Candidatus Saccharimonadales bacterium]